MKKVNSHSLLDQLQSDIREIILQSSALKQMDRHFLEQHPSADKWSVAQVLEHLNFYSSFYIPAIEKKLHLHQTIPHPYFHPGWLGNFFTNLMKPAADNRIVKKMKSPKNALPSAQPNAGKMLEEFLQYQHQLLTLLNISKSANLDTIRIPTSLSKLIQLKLGDTFRFFIAHEQRHFVQIQNVLHAVEYSVKEEEIFA